MTESQRHSAIIELLYQNKQVTVADIVSAFNISPATARRDINKLHEMGKLNKVRSGAELVSGQKLVWNPLNIYQAKNLDEKMRIAKAAALLCQPGESVVINCGSTAFLLGQEMCGKPIQVITNYLPLANYLIDREHESVIIMGGQYHKGQEITLTPQNGDLGLYAGHWMFTSGSGLTAEGLYKMDMLTAIAEQKMLSYVGKLVVLVDSSKIGQHAGMLFARTEQINTVITGQKAEKEVIKQLKAHNVNVILV